MRFGIMTVLKAEEEGRAVGSVGARTRTSQIQNLCARMVKCSLEGCSAARTKTSVTLSSTSFVIANLQHICTPCCLDRCRKQLFCDLNFYGHESDAPANFGATHTPFTVRILCTDFVSGLIQAAS